MCAAWGVVATVMCLHMHKQAGRQVYGNNNSINHTRSNDVGFLRLFLSGANKVFTSGLSCFDNS